ncbi:guanylin [Chanos chanos]|uniref:Guanylate cyclase activator 2B n=1 Tax=Chanos chanos TaxID=29144 RepID=A0A6J2VL84_CHACN|nr:guanylin-like [Chanos chanos]
MKTMLSVALLCVTLCLVTEAVHVKEGEFFFTLQSVKALQELSESSMTKDQNPRLAKTSMASMCSNPTLPQEFVPLCQQKGASLSLARLAAVPMDVCEICAYAACAGC